MDPEVKTAEQLLKEYESLRLQQVQLGTRITTCMVQLDDLQLEAQQLDAKVDAAKAALLGSVEPKSEVV